MNDFFKDSEEGQQNLFGDEPEETTKKSKNPWPFENYEDGVSKLENILEKIQDEELSLEENVKLYEEGMNLHQKLLEFLEEQELRVHNMQDRSSELPFDDVF